MEEKKDFLRIYEEEYKRIRNILLLGYSSVLSCFVCLTLWKGANLYRSIFVIASCSIIVFYVNYKYNQNANRIVFKYKQDMDTDFAIALCEKLLENRRRMDANAIWSIYLNLLLDTCQFEKFEVVYKKNQKWMKAIRMNFALKKIYFKCLSLQKDTTEYKKALCKNCFLGKILDIERLQKIKWVQGLRDKSKEVKCYYESKKYGKAIEKINQMDFEFPWDQMELYAEKQRCLYYLNEKYTYPQVESDDLLFIKRWRYLLEKGEEYSNEQIDEIVSVLKKDMKKIKRKRNGFKFILIVAVFMMIYPTVFDILFFLFMNMFL